MKDIAIDFLKKQGWLNDEEINAILDHTEVKSFQKGDMVARQGTVCHCCYLVLKGCLRQYHVLEDEEKVSGFFIEGQSVVLYSSYLRQAPADYSISCLEDSILLVGTRQQEQELHQKHPKLAQLTYSLMLEDYDKVENYITLLNGYKPEDRYLMLMEKQPELLRRVPLHQLASFLGITPESFSRIRKRISTKKS